MKCYKCSGEMQEALRKKTFMFRGKEVTTENMVYRCTNPMCGAETITAEEGLIAEEQIKQQLAADAAR